MSHSPKAGKRVLGHRVDWSERDERLLPVVRAVAQFIRLQEGRPRQITTTAVLREAGMESCLPKLSKLPRSREELARVIEDREAFACRRVRRVKLASSSNGHVPKLWELKQQAGLRPELMDRSNVKKALLEAMDGSS
jgi:hypothetical protein